MNRWLEKHNLKLTSKGDRIIVAGMGVIVIAMVGAAFWLESIINTTNGVI